MIGTGTEIRRVLAHRSFSKPGSPYPIRLIRCKAGGRGHPSRAKEKLCAEGRMLFLSLWPPQAGRLDNATIHGRCHEMGDLIVSRGV